MRFKNWLICELGGYTKQQYNRAMKHNFIEELENRVKNGNDVVIGVRNLGMFRNLINMFNKDTVEIDYAKQTIKYNDIVFRVINVVNTNQLQQLTGINLNGFFFID